VNNPFKKHLLPFFLSKLSSLILPNTLKILNISLKIPKNSKPNGVKISCDFSYQNPYKFCPNDLLKISYKTPKKPYKNSKNYIKNPFKNPTQPPQKPSINPIKCL